MRLFTRGSLAGGGLRASCHVTAYLNAVKVFTLTCFSCGIMSTRMRARSSSEGWAPIQTFKCMLRRRQVRVTNHYS